MCYPSFKRSKCLLGTMGALNSIITATNSTIAVEELPMSELDLCSAFETYNIIIPCFNFRIGGKQRSRYNESKPYDCSHTSYRAMLILKNSILYLILLMTFVYSHYVERMYSKLYLCRNIVILIFPSDFSIIQFLEGLEWGITLGM